jgi:deoxyadenosine/deoxycytidine kinase
MPILISIEGNIGAGKSTILEKVKETYKNRTDILFLREPVDIWESIKDENGKTILENFYTNPSKYAFSFQVMAYITRLSLLKKLISENPSGKIIICERSLEADKNIFAKMLHDDGVIDHLCIQIYHKIYEEYMNDFPLQYVIYIDANPEICLQRILQRSREGENTISIDYLQKCKDYYHQWLLSDKPKNLEILQIITNETALYNENPMDCGNLWIREINTFIAKINNRHFPSFIVGNSGCCWMH